MSDDRKKLLALDTEDLAVLSAHCQDAVLKISGIRYLAAEKRFILELNRFVWEKGVQQKERRKSVLHFERVEKVQSQGINQNDKDHALSLLAIIFKPTQNPAGIIDLIFSGDFQLRLNVECIEAQLTDMLASWEASSAPRHGV